MVEQAMALIRAALEKTGLIHLETELGVIANTAALLGVAVSGLLWLGRRLWRGVRTLRQTRPIDCLYNALAGYSTVSKTELIYQIRSYTPPRFKGEKQTIRRLLRQIKAASGDSKSSADVFSIVGAPATGKTAAMRYLYCRLSRVRWCVYLQMQDAVSMDALSRYVAEQKAANHIPDQEPVVAFFDGLDEAFGLFRELNPDSMEQAVRQLFFCGPDASIRQIFKNNHLRLDCTVLSLRPEFLDHSIKSLTTAQYRNIFSKVYRLAPMSNGDVIKTFRSLKVLKQLDHKLDKEEQRHQDRYPPFWKAPKYILFLRRILRKDPDGLCLFRYPMYIRYAYAFMQAYEEREAADKALMSNPNIAVSFDILVKAIIKWEFHVYYADGSAERNRETYDAFAGQMAAGARAITLALLKNQEGTEPQSFLTREQFSKIVEEHFPGEIGQLAIAHCFMTSDDEGKRFVFCHRTFYEYFLAQHLFQYGDYRLRRQHLCADRATDYLRMMYCGILCQNEELNGRIASSLERAAEGPLSPGACRDLGKEEAVRMGRAPQMSIVEILEYLPFIKGFLYCGQRYLRKDLENLMTSGTLDLKGTGWDRLEYARWVIPPERVKRLDISWLHLADAGTLHCYQHLQCLDMQMREDAGVLEQIVAELEGLTLAWIHIYASQGEICRHVDDLMGQGRLHIQKIYVNAPAYSQAHLRMHQLNQQAKDGGQPVRFYSSKRTDLKMAKDKYAKRDDKKDIPLLTAVFELEADGEGMLGLDQNGAEATLWNGLSLAYCLEKKDYVDENEQAIQVCRRIKPYISQDGSELSARFARIYGALLIVHSKSAQAAKWLNYTYQRGAAHFKDTEMIDVGLKLYKARIRSENTELDDLQEELLDRIQKLPDYEEGWENAYFWSLRCARGLTEWSKGTPEPEGLSELLARFKQLAIARREKKNHHVFVVNAAYFETVCANRREELEQSAQKLEELARAMEEGGDTINEQGQRGNWIKFNEQELYRLLLLEEKESILKIAAELLAYPHRRKDINVNSCKEIQQAYLSGSDEIQQLDRHIIWDWLWY